MSLATRDNNKILRTPPPHIRGQLPHIKPDTAGIPITDEILHALTRMSMKKAPGPDWVLTEMFVATGEYGLEELPGL